MTRIAVFLCQLLPSLGTAQTLWRLPTTAGYTSLGAAIGFLAVQGPQSDLDALPLISLLTVGGGVVGLVSGYQIGASADRKLARGETLSLGHRNAVRFGTVLALTTAGAVINVRRVQHTSLEDYSFEDALFSGAAAGAFAGALVQLVFDSSLRRPAKVRVSLGPDVTRSRTTIRIWMSP